MSIYWGIFFIVLGIFYLLWHWLWVPFYLDNFRSKLFNLRDELFDFACQGGVSFSSTEYCRMREWINSTLRFAHRITVTDIAFIFFAMLKLDNSESEKDQFNIESIVGSIEDKKTKTYFIELKDKIGLETAKFFILRSPSLWFVFGVFVICFALHYKLKQSVDKAYNWFFNKIEPELSDIVGRPIY